MTDRKPIARRPGRSNLWGAVTTLALEAAIVAVLAMLGLGASSLILWLTG